jgi:branched-chain amino acid transport system permease protein
MLIWGRDARTMPAFSGEEPITIGQATIVPQTLWVVGLTVVVVVALTLFYRKSLFGIAIRACAANPGAARLQGISYRRVVLFTFALTGGIAAAAGVMITPISFVSYSSGTLLGLGLRWCDARRVGNLWGGGRRIRAQDHRGPGHRGSVGRVQGRHRLRDPVARPLRAPGRVPALR